MAIERAAISTDLSWRLLRFVSAPLKRFPPHEAWLCGGRCNAFAHGSSPQRTDMLQEREPKAACTLERQEFRQQVAIEQINRERAAGHVGAAHLRIAGGQLIGAWVVSLPM